MKVRIKTWEELLATPGAKLHQMGIIPPSKDGHYFTDEMKQFCGQDVEVDCDEINGRVWRVVGGWWTIDEWMVTNKSENFNQLYNKLNGN